MSADWLDDEAPQTTAAQPKRPQEPPPQLHEQSSCNAVTRLPSAPAATDDEEPKGTDWVSIEKEYRAGQLSISELSRVFDISRAAINKRAKKNGWTRDLATQVANKVREQLIAESDTPPPVSASAVSAKVSGDSPATGVTPEQEQDAIENAAARVVAIVREHRSGIRNARDMVAQLLSELQTQTLVQAELEEFAEVVAEFNAGLRDPDTLDQRSPTEMEPTDWNKRVERFNRLHATFMKLIGLPSRAQVIQKLSDALNKLVTLERQAFDLDKAGDGDPKPQDHVPVEERLKRYQAERTEAAIAGAPNVTRLERRAS